jgi:phosphatidylglycerophosphate synthase
LAAIQVIDGDKTAAAVDFDSIHKLPRGWRYFNISVLWIFYYEWVIRLFYRIRLRHEVVTTLSILSGLAGAWAIARAQSLATFVVAAVLVHAKDVFDASDGALARLTGTGHRLGRFLDTIGDGIVFTAWIAVCCLRAVAEGMAAWAAISWGVSAWLSLFLQCSYFNFYQLNFIRVAGAGLTSRLDEREETSRGAVSVLARLYDVWFGWQDRLIARLDLWQRGFIGFAADPDDPRNRRWYGVRSFMVWNSALCFGTHAFILILCLLFQSPFWFLPVVTIGMNIYWVGIVLARLVVFRRGV